jgi:Family of unknown function (DUF6295)
MCTYFTVTSPVKASVKGPNSPWFTATQAVVYFDHPSHHVASHTVNIDFAVPDSTRGERVALELAPADARALIAALEQALDAAPPGLELSTGR